jgi:CheY-like chemotaxis protein
MKRPRVLLVEDDASIRRFLVMALEDQALDLVEAPLLSAAIDALRGPPFDLVLCDLMLPDGSGLDLLRALAGPDSPCPSARRVAFSAGVSATVRVQLEQAGVHEVLSKPAALADLEACVARALAGAAASAAAAAPPDRTEQATLHYFGGDVALYGQFLAQCRPQFLLDAATGERAAQQADLPALRRLAHSLKSVLLTLGFEGDSLLAARIEDSAAQGQADTAWALWPELQWRLQALAQEGAPAPAAAPAAAG